MHMQMHWHRLTCRRRRFTGCVQTEVICMSRGRRHLNVICNGIHLYIRVPRIRSLKHYSLSYLVAAKCRASFFVDHCMRNAAIVMCIQNNRVLCYFIVALITPCMIVT